MIADAIQITLLDLAVGLVVMTVIAVVVLALSRSEKHLPSRIEAEEHVESDWAWPDRKSGSDSQVHVDDHERWAA